MIHKIKLLLQWGIVLIAFVLGISLVKSISKIVGSNEKVLKANEEVKTLQKENENLDKELKNISSVQFIEGQARDKLGLAKKGEIVVVLPNEETLRSLAPKIDEKKYELPISNWEKWMRLFL